MKNTININGQSQTFPYIVEYVKDTSVSVKDIHSYLSSVAIRLFTGDVTHYRFTNKWIIKDENNDTDKSIIPNNISLSAIRVYMPQHSIETYERSIKYALSVNTWINGFKIDLGTFIFKQSDTYAYEDGPLKRGNNEYYSCIDFNIVNPFDIMYEEAWDPFRKEICNEKPDTNDTGSTLYVSLYAVEEFDESTYIIDDNWTGGCTCFGISNDADFLKLQLSTSLDPLGLKFDVIMNSVYGNDFVSYINETYGIDLNDDNVETQLEIVIKSKDGALIVGQQTIEPDNLKDNIIIKDYDTLQSYNFETFFKNWDTYEEGWSFVSSISILRDGEEIFALVSNELPITQEVFSIFTNNGSEKIIDIEEMDIKQYNLVNKIENKIFQIERPNDSKANIIQPVFFRVKDTEMLTLHPEVNENISINLDDYKSKVDEFILKIGDCYFKQIGSNSYGIVFKITANTLPKTAVSGTYYILDNNYELVTTGKYNCVR